MKTHVLVSILLIVAAPAIPRELFGEFSRDEPTPEPPRAEAAK